MRCVHCGLKFCNCQGGMFDEPAKVGTKEYAEPCDDPAGCAIFKDKNHCTACGRIRGFMPEVLPKARKSDPDTSHEAGLSMTDEAATQRRQILEYLEAHGPQTADALDEALGFRLTSAGRRMSELLRKALVRRTGEKEMTRSGRRADLWAYRR